MQHFKSHKPYNRPIPGLQTLWLARRIVLIRIEVKNSATGKDVTSTLRCLNDLQIIVSQNLYISTQVKKELCRKMCSIFAFSVRHVVSKYLHISSLQEWRFLAGSTDRMPCAKINRDAPKWSLCMLLPLSYTIYLEIGL